MKPILKKAITEWITIGLPIGIVVIFVMFLGYKAFSKILTQAPVYETRYCIDRRIAFDDCESKTFEEARNKSPNARIYIENNYVIKYIYDK